MYSKTFAEIANSHGSDKGTVGPSDSYGGHNYADIYEAYFSASRYTPINILEIGIGAKGGKWDARIVHGRNKEGGGSLKTWYEFFPNAQVYAIDINEATQYNNDRIHTFCANQGSREDMDSFLKKIRDVEFDFIIDDGSHRPDHQQLSLGILFPHLKSRGLYFIEDLYENGKGDGSRDRHSVDTVLNTRAVMRAFQKEGKFAEPNAIINPDYLAQNISSIAFHVPHKKIVWKALLARALGKRGMLVQERPNTEKLCVIRKK
jgi:hypothetical protein